VGRLQAINDAWRTQRDKLLAGVTADDLKKDPAKYRALYDKVAKLETGLYFIEKNLQSGGDVEKAAQWAKDLEFDANRLGGNDQFNLVVGGLKLDAAKAPDDDARKAAIDSALNGIKRLPQGAQNAAEARSFAEALRQVQASPNVADDLKTTLQGAKYLPTDTK
jgi:hypothetical protein